MERRFQLVQDAFQFWDYLFTPATLGVGVLLFIGDCFEV
jgi:hypothetical protein